MSMFQVCGQVMHLFNAPGRVDKETGDVDDDKPKVQLLGQIPQRNGEHKFEVITLTCHEPKYFESLTGKHVRVPLGMFSPSKGNIVYFIPEGCKPVLEGSQQGVNSQG